MEYIFLVVGPIVAIFVVWSHADEHGTVSGFINAFRFRKDTYWEYTGEPGSAPYYRLFVVTEKADKLGHIRYRDLVTGEVRMFHKVSGIAFYAKRLSKKDVPLKVLAAS